MGMALIEMTPFETKIQFIKVGLLVIGIVWGIQKINEIIRLLEIIVNK